MGAYCSLHVAISHPALVRSLVVAGCGYGSEPAKQAEFRQNCEAAAQRFERLPIAEAARQYADVPTRRPLRDKDPRGWAEFLARLSEHDPIGSAMTLRGVQMRRPSLWDLVLRMRAMRVPTLIVTGDRDEACLAPGMLMRREIPSAGLLVLPHGGHAINLEEPDWFNRALAEFLLAAEQGRWGRAAATTA
jgi:pimeloyl-ACP methyl ester carboxylesterase